MTPSPRTIIRAAAAGAALCGLAIAVSACGGSGSPAAAPGGASHTAAPSHTHSSSHGGSGGAGTAGNTAAGSSGAGSSGTGSSGAGSSTGSSTGSGTGTTVASAAACQTENLSVAHGFEDGYAGGVYTNIEFTNVGSQACTLYGYPGISFAGGPHATQVGPAAGEVPAPPRTLVTLKPGQMAYAVLRVVFGENYDSSQCHYEKTSYLRVYPPNQTESVLVPWTWTACAAPIGLLGVTTVQS
jgi:hypothetical protein